MNEFIVKTKLVSANEKVVLGPDTDITAVHFILLQAY
jgi:hypothetical protein